MLSRPTVSAVVPCRNEESSIESCLQSLLRQAPVPGGFEIIVADGVSTDRTPDILRRLAATNSNLRILTNSARITPCGMNLGIANAKGKYVAILGAHNQYASDYLAQCLEVAESTGADNVGGSMHCLGNGLTQRAIAAAHHSSFAVGGARWHNPAYEGPADTVFGGFYRREVFEKIGLFDESLVRNQDDEFNLRLIRTGGHIWHSPKIQSWYQPRESLQALFKQYYQYGYWKVRVIQKHRLPASWRHVVPGVFVFATIILPLIAMITHCTTYCLSHFTSFLTPDPILPNTPRLFIVIWLLMLASYLSTVAVASGITARRAGWDLLPILPPVFACYHLGYGWGFLRGVVDFLIFNRRAGTSSVLLTRN